MANKIVEGLKQAIRYARGDKTGARETVYHVPGTVTLDIDYPLPADGQAILWRAKGTTDWRAAVVDFVWLSLDEPAVSLVGGGNFMPGLGDEWKPSPLHRPQGTEGDVR